MCLATGIGLHTPCFNKPEVRRIVLRRLPCRWSRCVTVGDCQVYSGWPYGDRVHAKSGKVAAKCADPWLENGQMLLLIKLHPNKTASRLESHFSPTKQYRDWRATLPVASLHPNKTASRLESHFSHGFLAPQLPPYTKDALCRTKYHSQCGQSVYIPK